MAAVQEELDQRVSEKEAIEQKLDPSLEQGQKELFMEELKINMA